MSGAPVQEHEYLFIKDSHVTPCAWQNSGVPMQMRGLKGKKAWHPSEAGADVAGDGEGGGVVVVVVVCGTILGDGERGGVSVVAFMSPAGAAKGGFVFVKGA